MSDKPPALTPDEASAIEAIGGAAPAAPAEAEAKPEFQVEPALEPSLDAPAEVHEHGNEGGALHSGHDHDHAHHHDHSHAEPAHAAPVEDAEMAEMKSTMLESAELANRAAGMAAKAAGDMHGASTELIESYSGQKVYLVIVLAVFGLLMVMAISIFAFMSYRLQQRVAQADAMLLAVGKRVIAMDESLELFSGHGEALREVASKQDAIVSAQTKIELRLDEVMRGVQTAVDTIAKPPANDKDKAPDVAKLIKELDGKLQAQATAINNLSSQVRAVGSPAPARADPAAVRKEAEALVRQLKAAEASVKPPVPAAAAAAAAPAPKAPEKPVEKLVQYPRVQNPGKTPEGQ
jgi:methyl-accepting chemotaxis protein